MIGLQVYVGFGPANALKKLVSCQYFRIGRFHIETVFVASFKK